MNFEAIVMRRDKRDLREFVNLPFQTLSAPNLPGWFFNPPGCRSAPKLDSVRHPFWRTARREAFSGRENGKAVGRIAAIIDEKFNFIRLREKCGAFGFFECVDDGK